MRVPALNPAPFRRLAVDGCGGVRLAVLAVVALGGCDAGGSLVDAGWAFDASRPDTDRIATPRALAEGLAVPRGLHLRRDTLYVAESGGSRILAVPRAGGAVTALASNLSGPYLLDGDDTALYVTERDAGKVLRVSYAGDVVEIASGLSNPTEIRVAAGFAYWLCAGTDQVPGSLWRVPTAGGMPEKRVESIVSPVGLAVCEDGCVAYTAHTDPTNKAPDVFDLAKVGPPFGIATTGMVGYGLAYRGRDLYWAGRKEAPYCPEPCPYRPPGINWYSWVMLTSLDRTRPVSTSPPGIDRLTVAGDDIWFSTYETISRLTATGYEDVALTTATGDFAVADALYFTDYQAGKVYRVELPADPSHPG